MAVLLSALALACNGDSSAPLGEAHIVVGFFPAQGGTFNARINGRTFTSAGGFPVTLSSLGTVYELSGSFTGGSLRVTFAATTSTGVQSGSLVSLQGPGPMISDCDVLYLAQTTASQQFRLQFKATAVASLACS